MIPPHHDSPWNDPTIATLRELATHMSSTGIARVMGISRNARQRRRGTVRWHWGRPSVMWLTGFQHGEDGPHHRRCDAEDPGGSGRRMVLLSYQMGIPIQVVT